MKKVIQLLWKLFLFSFPFSLSLLLYEKNAYRFGNFNPWVTGFLYLPEVLLMGTFLIYLFHELKIKNETLKILLSFQSERSAGEKSALVLFVLFLINALVITFWKGDPVLFLFFLFHLFCAWLVYFFLKKEIIPTTQVIRWLLFGGLFQVVLAAFQTHYNHSLGLWFLGEPHVGPEVSNVAKIDVDESQKVIRGYGTFLHPNILGAYLTVILLISLPHLKKMALIFWPVIILFGVYLTGSRAAEITLLLLLVLYFIFRMVQTMSTKKYLVFGFMGLFLTVNAWFFFNSDQVKVADNAIAERLDQNEMAHQMILSNPWGVGMGNFTLKMENFSPSLLKPWNIQPVHNVYFLTLTQTGIQGLILGLVLMGLMLMAYFQKTLDYSTEINHQFLPFLGLLVMASFDHLLLTSYMGPLLIALVLAQRDVKV